MLDFTGRVAIVTEAGHGFGLTRVLALESAEDGIRFSPALDDETAAVCLTDVCADERLVAVPGCAPDEIDLIRASYPELASFRMTPR